MRVLRGAGPRPLIVLLCGIGIGCHGGGNADSSGRDAGSDAPAGSRLLRTLNFVESAALCDQARVELSAEGLATSDFCRGDGFSGALDQFFRENNSDAALQTACVLAYAACLSNNTDATLGARLSPPCGPINPMCPATVDQYWTCIHDLIAWELDRVRDFPLCHLITRDEISGRVFDAGMTTPYPEVCDMLANVCFFTF